MTMAHLENYTKKDLGKMLREHERSLKNYENKVDISRSDQNYGYGVLSSAEAKNSFNRRVTDVMNGKEVQEKTNICSEWVISCPVELMGTGKEKSFFDECWKFAGNRYGQENMISGFVHMDETRPHMHMMLVPEAISRKTGKRTVSSASLMTRAELSGFHKDLDKHCENVFGQKNLVKNGKTIADNVNVRDLARIQENVKQQYADEISGYRTFLGKIKYENGQTALEKYDKMHAPVITPTEAPTKAPTASPVIIPSESPQRPSEAIRGVLEHNSKVGGKTSGKTAVKKPTEEPDENLNRPEHKSYYQIQRETEEKMRQQALAEQRAAAVVAETFYNSTDSTDFSCTL